jgi:hypothetical protein
MPGSWDQVTAAWMTNVLAERCPGAVVGHVDLGDLDVGTTTRSAAKLTYAAGQGPSGVFIKAQGRLDHRLLLASIRCLRPEAWLLGSGIALPVDMPITYGTAIDALRLNCIVVTEDVTLRGASPNVATDPLPVERVRRGLDALALLHAEFWTRQLPASLRFVRPWSMFTGWAVMNLVAATAGLRKVRQLGRSDLLPSALTSPRRVYETYAQCARFARSGPQTLLHGDAHVGNTYSLPDGGIGFYDWQLVRTGSWAHDVGYFIGSALSIEDRRAHEFDLLRRYRGALLAAGVPAPTFDDMWTAYRRTPAYGYGIWLQTWIFGGYQDDAISESCMTRFAAAYEDLGTDQALR